LRVRALSDDDLHLALYVLYELHYRGFAGVDDEAEWDTGLLRLRARLESQFVSALMTEVGPPAPCEPRAVRSEIERVIANGSGPSLSSHMFTAGTLEQMREFAIHRSAYQLKEADPHTWGIPRLTGEAKAAMVEIQSDEYGNGSAPRMHSELFATTMKALGLDARYGTYLDTLPGTTLATVNLVSLFGLHRRWRGALVGHLAVFEMCSVEPMGRYAAALRRLGVAEAAARFFDVHVEADATHEVIAATRLAGGFAHAEPSRAGDVLFGARALMAVEERFARHLLDAWHQGRSSLATPGQHTAHAVA
jgi:hypothetical protein